MTEDLLKRIEALEESLKKLRNFVRIHHGPDTENCEHCRTLQGKPKLIGKQEVSRIFNGGNQLDQVDAGRKKIYFRNIFNLCSVKAFQEITMDQWPEVEKIVISVENEMRELGIQPIKREWKK